MTPVTHLRSLRAPAPLFTNITMNRVAGRPAGLGGALSQEVPWTAEG
jgi:hypothetical protein